MLLIVNLSLHTAHGTVKGLALHSGMGGNIEFKGAFSSGPFHSFMEKFPSNPQPPHILRHMNAGQVKISLPAAKKIRFNRGKSLKASIAESPAHESACADRILQAKNQKLIVFL